MKERLQSQGSRWSRKGPDPAGPYLFLLFLLGLISVFVSWDFYVAGAMDAAWTSLGHMGSFKFGSSTQYCRVGYPAVLRRRVFVSPKEREGMFCREKQHMTQKLITKTTKTSSGLWHLRATFAIAE